MGSKIGEPCILNQSIHNQVDKIKIAGTWGLLLLVYLYKADATSVHISVLAVIFRDHYNEIKSLSN